MKPIEEEYDGFCSAGGRHEEGVNWFPLDNAAKIFPSIQGAKYTTLFRLAVVLDHPVKIESLQRALDRVMQRYPYFLVEVRRGIFWYYLERLDGRIKIGPDGRSPCMRYHLHVKGAYLLRVRVYRRRIAVEFCHALTDGVGASFFLRSLVCEYFRQCGTEISDWMDIPNPDDHPEPGEFRDANQIMGLEKLPYPVPRSAAYHVKGQLIPKHEYKIITGLIPLDQIQAVAHGKGASVTEYLTAVLFWSLQDWIDSQPAWRQKKWKRLPLRVLIPVNMRPYYPSRTRRNFFLFVDPEIDLRLGSYDFEEILERVHSYMRLERTKKSLNRHLARNVGGERSWYVRIMPLFLKDIVIKIIYHFTGDRRNTTSFSSLGKLKFPPEVSSHIDWAEFIPPPSAQYRFSVSSVIHEQTVALTFGSFLWKSEIEKRFFRFLRRQGVQSKIISNKEAICHTVRNAE